MSSLPNCHRLAVRWTIGSVRPRGFEMLRLSVHSAFRLFGPMACYLVCVNSISIAEAQDRTGPLPAGVEWRQVTAADYPDVLRRHCDTGMMEGMGWKLAPLRAHFDRYELALDNDCILWGAPAGMRQWLAEPNSFLFAQDLERYLGSFDALCPPGAYNAGIRGLPPGCDLSDAIEAVLTERAANPTTRGPLVGEIEEQGLQAAAMLRQSAIRLVTTSEVTLCSPFWPRTPEFGTCGAHFVGMNAAHIPFDYYDRPADDWLADHWQRSRPALYERAGLPLPEPAARERAA